MSSNHLAALKRIYARWSRGDFASAEDLDPDMEFCFSAEFPEQGVHKGSAAVSDAMREWLQAWEGFRLVPERFIEVNGAVVVFLHSHAIGKHSGFPVESEGANVWELRDGKPVRLTVYQSRAAALAAVGLRE